MYLSFVKHIATINSLKVEILGDICMNKDADKGTVCHYELTIGREKRDYKQRNKVTDHTNQ